MIAAALFGAMFFGLRQRPTRGMHPATPTTSRRSPMHYTKWLTLTAIAFVAYYLFTRPAKAAGVVNGVFDTVVTGADRLAVFLTHIV
jgi:hypothetical protein